jgi:hypothetical protein
VSLTAETDNRSQTSLVWLRGDVTETVSFPELFKTPPGHDLILYLADVRRLNSFGVREWIRGMTAVLGPKQSMIWVECSYNVVQQLNMIQGFAGSACVCSVRAPFTCDKCGNQEERPVSVLDWNGTVPDVACSKCGAPMQLDEEPESFFAFCMGEKTVTPKQRELFDLYLNWNNPNAVRSGAHAVPAAPPVVEKPPPTPPPSKPKAAAKAPVTQPSAAAVEPAGRRGEVRPQDASNELKARYFLYGFAAGAVATALTMGLWMAVVM